MSAQPAELGPKIKAAQRAKAQRSDAGNADRLIIDHGDDILFVVGAGWHFWDGKRWCRDDHGELLRRARMTVQAMRAEAARLADKDDREALWKFATASEKRERLKAMVGLAEIDLAVLVRADDLDADPFLLNVENGTIDLRTGKLREHRRADLITKLAPVAFDAEAGCPIFDGFLAEVVPDVAIRFYLQRALGYSLTGDTREQCLFMPEGSGANGKTTLLGAMGETLGDYAATADGSSFMTQRGRGVRSDIARLRGARFVAASEIEDDARLAEVLIKQMTGGDNLVASFLYQNEFEFRPTFKVFVGVNHLPEIRGDDHAIWRRVRAIPFHVKVERPDKTLPEKLRAERPGILAWAVRGCLSWQEKGLYPPEAIRAATEDYRARESHRRVDTVEAFVTARCRRAPGATASPSELYDAYRVYCDEQGLRRLGKSAFKGDLEELGPWRDDDGKRRLWRGIGLSERSG